MSEWVFAGYMTQNLRAAEELYVLVTSSRIRDCQVKCIPSQRSLSFVVCMPLCNCSAFRCAVIISRMVKGPIREEK